MSAANLMRMENASLQHAARRDRIDRIAALLDAARILADKPKVCAGLLESVAAEAQRLQSWLERGTI